ncbi:SDR family oxidoreductase [Lysobacter solisilvae (ex Woo and Kim 2020)]|uniref:SDR family oxidoreductase n=1 Tax=Agrilutibacter terrestris TaxID=2865112 RepID=A0A7H0FYF1_9GAMM|nr:SDR family oxidoreductase [Lysobacter terrestris]QNP41067.1 SDR family oxidoreductase [Lysobacter terrestris]
MSSQNADKIALVTGATRGIGFETVRQLAAHGVQVLLAGRDHAKAVEASLKLQSEGLPVEAVTLDVTDSGSIAAAVQEVERKHGRLDILVNNAGIIRDDASKPRSAQTLQAWRETFDTNLFGLIETTQAFLPLLRKSAAGRIVNVSSALGSLALTSDTSTPYSTFTIPAYNVSKSAVNAWTVQLAHDLRDSGIKVNTIHPGYVRTDMNKGEGELEVAQGAETSVQMALLGEDGPSGTFQYRGEVLPW